MATLASFSRRLARAVRFGIRDHRSVFEHIFEMRYWGDRESVSGCGSSLEQTVNIRRELPKIIEIFGVRRIFDAPCGDLHWMREVLAQTDVAYIGGDIVAGVVDLARSKTTRANTEFTVFDITEDRFPQADLWICRDVLFHLSTGMILKALKNFASSEIPYMLVTSHTNPKVVNRNMTTGDFRQLDLLRPPFSLPADAVLHRFADFAAPQPERDMLLFRREDISRAVTRP